LLSVASHKNRPTLRCCPR